MKKGQVKPFTLFLLLLSLLFLILFPLWVWNRTKEIPTDPFAKELSEWSGVITLWDIPYVQAGRASHAHWLKDCINNFEKKHPGVFIDVRTMTAERLAMYLHGDIKRDVLPDMISLGVYEQPVPENLLTDLTPAFGRDELAAVREPALEMVMFGEKMIGVPWMMGCYALYVNQEIPLPLDLDLSSESMTAMDYKTMDYIARKGTFQNKSGKRTIDYYGFCTYTDDSSKPLLGMIYQKEGNIRDNDAYQLFQEWMQEDQKVMPPNVDTLPYSAAFRLFALEKRAGMLLGSSKVIFDTRNLQASGKGVEYKVYPLPMAGESGFFMDQVASYGLLIQENDLKERACILFLKSLLEEEAQSNLASIGMFSVLKNYQLYENDAQMNALEQSLDLITSSPRMAGKAAEGLWNSLFDATAQDE
jgi:multiple sugar transport system substrate-binding protein